MKRIFGCVAFVLMLLVCTAASIETVYGTENYSGYEVDLVNDSSGVFLTRQNRNTLYVKKVAPSKIEYKYEFENKIAASCIYKNKIYVLYDSARQDDISYVVQFENGESKKKIMLVNLKHPTTTQMSVDDSGNLYIINDKACVELYDKNGERKGTYNGEYYSTITLSGRIYVSSHNGIFLLGSKGFEKIGSYTYSGNSYMYRISDNFIGDKNGNIYRVKNKAQKILSTNNKSASCCGETDNYLISFNGNKLMAYNKDNGRLINSIPLDYTPKAVSAYNNKVIILNAESDTYSIEIKKEKEFDIPQTEQETEPVKTDSSLSSPLLKFGEFKPKGKYIYIPQGTTYSNFKQSVTYRGYEISFNERSSGNIGTGTTVTFTISKREKQYIFVTSGDITGEGNINTRDIDKLFAQLLKNNELKNAYKKAADLNADSKISNADLVLMVRNYEKQK